MNRELHRNSGNKIKKKKYIRSADGVVNARKGTTVIDTLVHQRAIDEAGPVRVNRDTLKITDYRRESSVCLLQREMNKKNRAPPDRQVPSFNSLCRI